MKPAFDIDIKQKNQRGHEYQISNKKIRGVTSTRLDWMTLDSALKKVVPDISQPKKSRPLLSDYIVN
jgi:hypothetical protein